MEAMSSKLLTILNEQHDKESDPRKPWEFIKYSVRKFSFQYSRANLSVCEKEDKIWKNEFNFMKIIYCPIWMMVVFKNTMNLKLNLTNYTIT